MNYELSSGTRQQAALRQTTWDISAAQDASMTATFDDGRLTISGKGAMPNYADTGAQPWASYRTAIHTVVVTAGVTAIGSRAFRHCENLSSVSLPVGVTDIGHSAFAGCSALRSVVIPNSVAAIGDMAFGLCGNLRSLTLLGKRPIINATAFLYCGLREIKCLDPCSDELLTSSRLSTQVQPEEIRERMSSPVRPHDAVGRASGQ